MRLTNWLSRISTRRFASLQGGLRSRRTGRHRSSAQARCLETLEDRTLLATFTVSNTADAGAGSLRQAVIDANAAGGTDVIDATGVTGTITLTTGQLGVTGAVTITGPGTAADLVIDAQGNSRVFRIDTGVTATLTNLTVTNGDADSNVERDFGGSIGGGILNAGGTLTLDNVHVTNSTATWGGGINNYGNGGTATITIVDSTVEDNTATTNAGGLYNWGNNGNAVTKIERSTFTRNTAVGDAGGIASWPATTELNIVNSSIVQNTADDHGAMVIAGGVAVITNSTIAGNSATNLGGGLSLFSNATVTLNNSILAGNVSDNGTASDAFGDDPFQAASANNLIGDAASAGGLTNDDDGDPSTGSNNIVGVDWKTVLENDGTVPTLTDNGGLTQTVALLEGSLAIDAGSNALAVDHDAVALTVDQRGEPRTIDGDGNGTSTVDIGAFERPPTPRIIVSETDGDTTVSENVGIDTVEISLNLRPDTDVIVTVESGDVTEFVVDLQSLTFTTDNWDVPQTVQVMGIDDREFDGDVTSSLTVEVGSGSDALYSSAEPVSVTVTTTDNETTTPAGQGLAFDNYAPTQSVTYVIALVGLFPSQGGGLPDSSEPLLGQIVMGGWNFAPRGFAYAEGQLLAISNNTALFSILGTTYGGDGETNFALPDLRGRVPIGADPANGLPIGTQVGSATVTLTEANLPSHTHDHAAGTLAATGGGQAFDNQQPALALTAVVRTIGTFESLGEIVWFAGNFAPDTEAVGQLLQLSQHTALFSQLGTTYGGDGETTFGLPDLRGRAAVGFGTGDGLPTLSIGQQVGETLTTLDTSHLPTHDHELSGTDTSETGGSQAFTNVSPGLALRYMVSVSGLFPSRSFVADPFIGEIAITAAPFADPFGWVNTEGQLLEIAPNAALFSLLGTTFGGDGRTTFRLPDLRGRFATHFTSTQRLGSEFGSVEVTLTDATLPTHVHEFIPAEEYVVTTATDELDFSNADVSLREAIVAANYHAGTQDITFAASLIGSTISLTAGQLELADDITITGPGTAEELVIDAQGLFRVFRVDSGVTATLSDLTVTNGDADFNVEDVLGFSVGGGILNAAGTLTIESVRFIQNDAEFGGGIFNDGDGGTGLLSIRDSTFWGNTGVFAGGLGNSGVGGDATASVSGSTFADNSVSNAGGAILNFEAGATLNIVNSTLSNNEADFGAAVFTQNGAVLTFVNSTVVGNTTADTESGGIHGISGSVTSLHNTILAGNVLDNGTASDAFGDPFQAASANNLIGDAATAGGLVDGTTGNIVGVDWKTVLENDGTDPILADNGGTTQTIALLVGTDPARDAIDAGENALAVDADGNALTHDQRGFTRILDGDDNGTATVDIGAVEAGQVAPETLEVDNISDIRDGDYSAGELSLREAILIANAQAGADTITFASSLAGMTITLDGKELPITDDVTITGPGADELTIDANDQSRIFQVNDGTALTDINVRITGLTLTGGTALYGGAVQNFENLSLFWMSFQNNSAPGIPPLEQDQAFIPGRGGAVHSDGHVTIIQSLFSGNSASDGAAIYSLGTVTILDSTVAGNSGGGASAAEGSGHTIDSTGEIISRNNTITGNTGGSAIAASGPLSVANTIVAGNGSGDISGTVTGLSANNILGTTGNDGGLTNGTNGNQVGVDWKTVVENNGTIATLTDNGGLTHTIALLTPGPAIDAGDNASAFGLTRDQRSDPFARIVDGDGDGTATVDVGAFEASLPPQLTVVIADASISEDGGISTATVSRTGVTTSALTVTLTSNDTTEARVPGTVTIAAGQSTSPAFSISAVDDTIVDGTQTVTVTASATGTTSGSDTVDVTDDDTAVTPVLSVDIAAASIGEGSGTAATTGTVTRTGDTTAALTVTLTSNDTTEATVPGTVTIAAGQSTSPAFSISAVDDAIVDGTQTVTVTASATGTTSGSDTVDVTDDDTAVTPVLSVNIAASSIGEGSGTAATTGTVTRTGDTTAALTVTLTSNDTTEATVPGTVTIAAGQSISAPFNIDAVDDATADGAQTVTVTASATGLNSGTDTVIVTDDETASLTVSIAADSVSEADGTAATTATVTRDGDTSADLVVTLLSDDTTGATVPATVTILAGQTTSAPFNITAVDDVVADGPQTVTVTAVATGLNSGTDTVIVTDDEAASLTVSIAADSVSEGDGTAATTATVTRDGDTSADLVVTLMSDDTTEATVPATITIAAGQTTSASFDITAVDDSDVDGTQTVTITVSANGLNPGNDTVDVTDDDSTSGFLLDVDGDGTNAALSDGILILRDMAGFTGSALVDGAINNDGGTRTDPADVAAYLDLHQDELDIDGSGTVAALSDGILVLRYLAGFRGDALIANAVDQAGTRTTAAAIESHLDQFLGGTASGPVAFGAVPSANADAVLSRSEVDSEDFDAIRTDSEFTDRTQHWRAISDESQPVTDAAIQAGSWRNSLASLPEATVSRVAEDELDFVFKDLLALDF